MKMDTMCYVQRDNPLGFIVRDKRNPILDIIENQIISLGNFPFSSPPPWAVIVAVALHKEGAVGGSI